MAFRDVSQSSSRAPDRETAVLQFWKEHRIYHKCVEAAQNGSPFIFFEGPPTANGKPGIHHVLSRVFKDIYVRFHTQRGEWVPRKAGWDCHGLPVEREVEKELGIQSKSEIESKYGIEKFNELCRQSVLRYVDSWNQFSERLGFWVDYEDAYYTMDNDYIESVWSLLKIIWDKGLIYRDYKVVPFDPVMGATMSDAEVALGYKTVEDPSLTAKFELADETFGKNAYLLVWTTTPWTLPSNVAAAVHPDEDYVVVEVELEDDVIQAKAVPKPAQPPVDSVAKKAPDKKPKAKAATKKKSPKSTRKGMAAAGAAQSTIKPVERLICASKLEAVLFGDKTRKVVQTIKGRDLAGTHYNPLFSFPPPDPSKKSHYIVAADFVTMDTGTGIVHIAPAYGADDLETGRKYDLPVIHAVGQDGRFVEGTAWAGEFFKEADPHVIRALKDRGLVFKSERYKHEYPFGWRTGAPLLYFAKEAWYIRTTSMRDNLIRNNQSIRWVPEHLKEGRFGNWLENNRDWALSRERYWGTPLPIWMDDEGNTRIVGSAAELEALSGQTLSGLDLHRPFVDRITFTDKTSGKTFKRVPEVIDCWFDSGAMPYAQWGWPVRGKEDFAKAFPADFISEAVDQTRGWFYTLLAISTMVSDSTSYKNVVCLGHVLDAKGEKMSKTKGNTVDPESVFASHGADAIRWYFLTGAPPGNSRRVGKPGEAGDPVVNVHGLFNMLLNSAGFFALYANVDKVEIGGDWLKNPVSSAPEFSKRLELDRWILSRLQVLIRNVTASLFEYDAQKAGRLMEEFLDGLSNWYIRRNRRRFWKGEVSGDKLAAYDTLHRCLVTLARLMAPFTPFLAEDVFRALVSETGSPGAPESVHLSGWPSPDFANLHDPQILAEGDLLQNAAVLGRAARMQSGVKVRQPLRKIMVHVADKKSRDVILKYRETLLDELNVKELEFLEDSSGILDYRAKPNLPRLGKRLGSRMREVQDFFKGASARELAANVRLQKSTWIGSGENAIELEAEDILIESSSKEGTSGAEGGGVFVALDTTLNEELIHEGIVRDIVRNVQELRKKSDLNVTDRIFLKIEAPPEIEGAVRSFGPYLEGEVLGRLEAGNGVPSGKQDLELDGKRVQITIWKV